MGVSPSVSHRCRRRNSVLPGSWRTLGRVAGAPDTRSICRGKTLVPQLDEPYAVVRHSSGPKAAFHLDRRSQSVVVRTTGSLETSGAAVDVLRMWWPPVAPDGHTVANALGTIGMG